MNIQERLDSMTSEEFIKLRADALEILMNITLTENGRRRAMRAYIDAISIYEIIELVDNAKK